MKLQRTRNAVRNIIFGSVLKIYQIVVPFLLRTAMIYYLGIEYVGLNSIFLAILQVLNLAELGVGSAMIFSMYKPIAENDDITICALMALYRKYYRIIGLVISIGGTMIAPVLPFLIKGDIPQGLNLYVLYFLNLISTVLTYWLFAYKNCILTAYQRTDASSKIGLIISTVEYGIEFVALLIFRNYYLYLSAKVVTQIMNNILTAMMAEKMYPQYKPKGNLSKETIKEINKKVKDLFTAKLGGVVVNSVDSIVISSFLGLTVLAIYNNYYYILSSIIGFVAIIFSSCLAGIGNSIQTETAEKNYEDFLTFTLIIVWLSGFCVCCLLCLYQPFMIIWLKDTAAMFGMKEVICLCAYFFTYEIASMMIQYKDAAGIWHEDRFRPLVTALSNLVMNLITVQFIGIVGVLISTVISFVVIGIPWLIKNIFTLLFKRSPIEYIKRILLYVMVTIFACIACKKICDLITTTGWIQLIIKGVLCCIVSNIIFWIAYHRLKEYKKIYKLFAKLKK